MAARPAALRPDALLGAGSGHPAAAGAPPGTTVIGIDEDTAIVDLSGGGRSWQVHGRQRAWMLDGGQDGSQWFPPAPPFKYKV